MEKINEIIEQLEREIEWISVQHHTGGYEHQQDALKTLENLKIELRNCVKIKKCNIIPIVNDCPSFDKDGYCNLIDSDCPHRI